MMSRRNRLFTILACLVAGGLCTTAQAAPLGTGITYQGRLSDGGSPADGVHNFEFSLWNDEVAGDQVGATLVFDGLGGNPPPIDVVQGLFTIELDFGDGAFIGEALWLQIVVNGTPLTPRQRVAPAPMALALPGLYTREDATSPNIIGGFIGNEVGPAVFGATIGGGGATDLINHVLGNWGTVGGGADNTSGALGAVGGGASNAASGTQATVSGGLLNVASGNRSTIGGGESNTAVGFRSTTGGGHLNTANGENSTIGGGDSNTAGGEASAIGGGGGNTVDGDGAAIGGGVINTAGANYATIGGGFTNAVDGVGATVGGGRYNQATGMDAVVAGGYENFAGGGASTIGGGVSNVTTNVFAVIAGGFENTAFGAQSIICGGAWNEAFSDYSVISGGWGNEAGEVDGGDFAVVGGGELNTASGFYATVGGGGTNTASGFYATIPGGWGNSAEGDYSFAAGSFAKASHRGAFVWGDDSTDDDVVSSANNQVTLRAAGGYRLFTSSALTAGVQLAPGGGSWSSISDRNMKENFAPVDAREVVERIAAMPITTWNYKSQNAAIRHMGPMAQDFSAAFGLGEDELRINTIDIDGVALAAIQGLHQMVQEKDARLVEQQRDIDQLRARLERIERAMLKTTGTIEGDER